MQVTVAFFSFFRDLTGCSNAQITLPEASRLEDLLSEVHARFPKLAPFKKSTLMAVGLEYQTREHPLKQGDEVSLFPPVQGG